MASHLFFSSFWYCIVRFFRVFFGFLELKKKASNDQKIRNVPMIVVEITQWFTSVRLEGFTKLFLKCS